MLHVLEHTFCVLPLIFPQPKMPSFSLAEILLTLHGISQCHSCHKATLYPILSPTTTTKFGFSHTSLSFHRFCLCPGHSTSFNVIRFGQLYFLPVTCWIVSEGACPSLQSPQSLTPSEFPNSNWKATTEKLQILRTKKEGWRGDQVWIWGTQPPSPYLTGTPHSSEKLEPTSARKMQQACLEMVAILKELLSNFKVLLATISQGSTLGCGYRDYIFYFAIHSL